MHLRGGLDVAQHGADVNRLAVIAAVIFTELLHAENFTQRRADAKKFLTRIPRINTNSIFESPSGWHLCSWTIRSGQSSVGAKASGKGRKMPPRRGCEIFGLGFYKDVAPMALGIKTKEAKSMIPQKFQD